MQLQAFLGRLICISTSRYFQVLAAEQMEIANDRVMIDMVQNMPGDAVGWQQTKYFDPAVLKAAGYTGQTTTGEMSGTQAVDFSSLGHDFFPAGSVQRQWLDTYSKGVSRFVKRAHAAGVKAYFFVDLLVFPSFVIDAFANATDGNGKLIWNAASKQLLSILVDETFAKFPGCDGWIVRTGETYVYDTPYHVGNSPSNGTMDGWVDFISTLREMVCLRHSKQLFIRSWDNWESDANYYESMTDRIPTHPLLYFSIKHSPGDFTRPAGWNSQLATGKHAQIVEVELQREYEGKGAFPNYVMSGIIDGFPEMAPKIGLQHIVDSAQLKGIWTWTRGGGWWGPYIHGQEQWVDLHFQVLSHWWAANGSKPEAEVFTEVTPILLPGCSSASCLAAFRNFSLSSADVVLHGHWGVQTSCGIWMRDDRIGGLDQVGCLGQNGDDDAKWAASLNEKIGARDLALKNVALFEHAVKPSLKSKKQAEIIGVSAEYAAHLFTIVAAGWPLLQYAYRLSHHLSPLLSPAQLSAQIQQYDGAWAAYRAYGLAEFYAPSLYHPYYLCLGTSCNGAFDPPPSDMQPVNIEGKNAYGIGHTVDQLRVNRSLDYATIHII